MTTMKKLLIFISILIILVIFISGCQSYSPEVQNKIDECKGKYLAGDCQIDVALQFKDKAICNEIENRHYKEVCKILIERDFKRCDEIKNWDFSERKINSKQTDISEIMKKQVELIMTPSKTTTEAKCYTKSAELTNDDSYCLRIETNIDKKECLQLFPEKWTEEKLCEVEYGDDEWGVKNCKDFAINKEAFNTTNPERCLDIYDKSIRTRCINNIFRKTGNIDLCNEYRKYVFYDSCVETNFERYLSVPGKLD